jgi:hypothetical protein
MRGLLLVEGEDIETGTLRRQTRHLGLLEETHPAEGRDRDAPGAPCTQSPHPDPRDLPGIGAGERGVRRDAARRRATGGDGAQAIDYDNYDTYRHAVTIDPAPLALVPEQALPVNSYHHQGIRKLARRFRPMAHAGDGLIEAYWDPAAKFVVGLQFHPERMLDEHPGNLRVWKAFGAAVSGRGAR